MNRRLKKFLYGGFYLTVLFLVLFGVYKSIFKTAPTCFDKKQNGGETAIDCGGPCESCEVLALEPIETIGAVKFFGLSSGKAVLAALVENPNTDYGASFFYTFKIYDEKGNLLEIRSGRENIFQAERKYIYDSGVESIFRNISKVESEISNPLWVASKNLSKPDLSVSDVLTASEAAQIKVSGLVKNIGPLDARQLQIIAFLSNNRGWEIFASKTFIDYLPSFSEKPFEIYFPTDSALKEKLDVEVTEVFVSSVF